MPWRDVFPAVTTQFKPDLSLDLDATAAHIESLVQSGVAGIVMLGSLGENNTLTPEEKLEVVRMAVQTSNQRVPVVSGVSELTTPFACGYVQKAQKCGADGFMVLPAMVYHSDQQETLAHFNAVAAATDRPIIVYNNPLAYKVDITPQMLDQMAANEQFVAVKESSGDTRRITDIFNQVGDRYTIFAGVDDLALECAALGATGWIAGIGLAFPEENQSLWDLMMAGRWEQARDIYRWYTPLLHLDVGTKFVQNIKLAIEMVGLGSERVRAPRLALTGAERDHVVQTVEKALATRPHLPVRNAAN